MNKENQSIDYNNNGIVMLINWVVFIQLVSSQEHLYIYNKSFKTKNIIQEHHIRL